MPPTNDDAHAANDEGDEEGTPPEPVAEGADPVNPSERAGAPTGEEAYEAMLEEVDERVEGTNEAIEERRTEGG
jgi:hypothetical protein